MNSLDIQIDTKITPTFACSCVRLEIQGKYIEHGCMCLVCNVVQKTHILTI